MNKKIFVAIIVIIVIIIGTKVIFIDKNKNVKIDISKLAAELLDSQIFEDNLDEIDKETVIKRYGFNSEIIKNIKAYIGTGATSEEILIIELSDKNGIEEIEKNIEMKIEERKNDFQNYLPQEIFKLENYVLENKGNYIILCISNNYDKAKEVININSN